MALQPIFLMQESSLAVKKENLLLWAVSLLSNYLISRGSQSFYPTNKALFQWRLFLEKGFV